jgi:membrane-bound metal-dependent hydrolase YbcI (DUF457 family)
MSRSGHLLSAAALSASAIALDPSLDRIILAVGLTLGASLPDQAEFVFGFGPDGRRYSLLKHRGLSHMPWPWALLALALLQHGWLAQLIGGLALGALLHLILDAFSPSGIPLLPGRHRSFGYRHNASHAAFIYRTGTMDELVLLGPIALAAAATIGTHVTSFTTVYDTAVASIMRLIP